jgi:hypothetical protein
MDKDTKILFDTQGEIVHCLINIDTGVNLAAIDNKLYLLHSGEIVPTTATTTASNQNTQQTENSTTNTTTVSIVTASNAASKVVVLTYPIEGEIFELGQTINIQWSSEKSVNDAVKITLRQNGIESAIINSKTANTGSYEWEMPLSTVLGMDYQIYLEWLSASSGSVSESNYDISGNFSIVSQTTTTTTSTTTPTDPGRPSESNNRGIPIIELPIWEYITSMIKDPIKDWILFSTSEGRILRCDQALFNAYLTGEKTVYANVTDGFGNISDTASVDFFYALYRKIAEITSDHEIVRWKYVVDPAAISIDEAKGIFLSPIFSVKEDLGFWKELIWEETKPTGTETIIYMRNASSEEELKLKPWDYGFYSLSSESGTITRELNNIGLNGKYLQLKTEMTTLTGGAQPSIAKITVNYSTKQATYFFTSRISLENNANAQKGLLVATMTEPQNTEIKFGISSINSIDWNDYQIVNPEEAFTLNNLENIKVGIKFISYDEHIPEIDEFALIVGSEKMKVLRS